MKRLASSFYQHLSQQPGTHEVEVYIVSHQETEQPNRFSALPDEILERIWCWYYLTQTLRNTGTQQHVLALLDKRILYVHNWLKAPSTIDRQGLWLNVVFNQFEWEHRGVLGVQFPVSVRCKTWAICFMPTLVAVSFKYDRTVRAISGTNIFVDPDRAIIQKLHPDDREEDELQDLAPMHRDPKQCEYTGKLLPFMGKRYIRSYHIYPGHLDVNHFADSLKVRPEWIRTHVPNIIYWSCTEIIKSKDE